MRQTFSHLAHPKLNAALGAGNSPKLLFSRERTSNKESAVSKRNGNNAAARKSPQRARHNKNKATQAFPRSPYPFLVQPFLQRGDGPRNTGWNKLIVAIAALCCLNDAQPKQPRRFECGVAYLNKEKRA